MKLREIVNYADGLLKLDEIRDFDNALNGLQIENDGNLTKIGAAVDASTATIRKATEAAADFLIVHHGLFWSGLRPVTGMLREQLRIAFEKNLALYSVHLPLDLHPEIGNNAVIATKLGLSGTQPFGEVKGQPIGVQVEATRSRDELLRQLEEIVGAAVRCFGAGPAETKRIGIVSGGAGGEIYAAAAAGIDTYITGEAPHWAAVAAEELKVNLIVGGHYATETFGVKALAEHLAQRFQLPWVFIDHPTGL